MRVSENVESALHVCVILAAVSRSRRLPASRLAQFHDLPAASLSKQVQLLAVAGLIVGSTGRVGGYRLARPAAEITVLDVVQAVEGSEPGFRCQEIRRRGPCTGRNRRYTARCAVALTMDAAEEAWRDALRAVSLADLGSKVAAQLDARTVSATQKWLAEHAR